MTIEVKIKVEDVEAVTNIIGEAKREEQIVAINVLLQAATTILERVTGISNKKEEQVHIEEQD